MKWDAALNRKTLFNRATLDKMWSPARLTDGRERPYGFGWHLGNIGNRKIVFHAGAWQGFKSFVGRVLSDQRTFIFLANSWDTHEFKLAQGLLNLYYPVMRHREWRTVVDKTPADTARMRKLLMQIIDGSVSAEQFTNGATAQLFRSKILQVRDQLRSLSIPVAVIHTSELISSDTTSDSRSDRHLLSDVLRSLVLTIEFAADGKISDLRLEPA